MAVIALFGIAPAPSKISNATVAGEFGFLWPVVTTKQRKCTYQLRLLLRRQKRRRVPNEKAFKRRFFGQCGGDNMRRNLGNLSEKLDEAYRNYMTASNKLKKDLKKAEEFLVIAREENRNNTELSAKKLTGDSRGREIDTP